MSGRRVQLVWPDREDLHSDPPLAILAALDATLGLAILSLAAHHPSLSDCERPYYLPALSQSDEIAEKLATVGHTLQLALDDYRKAIVAENAAQRDDSSHSDKIPF